MDNRQRIYTLREIAKWVYVNKTEVNIPDLQRGLVWKARQMELLWDSILRGFPIGSFILSDDKDKKYFLMDGQQRLNAIATGFGTSERDVLLWLDIHPAKQENSTRAFWVKATTAAHPWGFNNNDDCSMLSSAERRKALEDFGMKGRNIYQEQISLFDTWPVKARKPIPLRFFLEAPLDSAQSFADAIIKSCGERAGLRWAQLSDEDVMIIKEKYYNVFKNLDGYTVQCDILSHTVIERESSEKDETHETTSLEILFNRLNTGGTRISQHDLNYSAIKAYWPDIKKVNDTIAKRYMPPSKLVMLAFRLALTKMDSSKGLCNPLSVRQIRTLAMNSEAKDCINRVYDHLDDIMKRIDEWLYVYDGQTNTDPERMPAYIRTSIAHKSPEVFLLLMYLASEDLDKRMQISPSEVRGLALLLHWFSLDQKNAVGVVFGNIHSGGNEEMTLRLRKALSECTGKNLLLPVFSPDEMHQFIQIKANPDWNPWSAKDYAPWYDFYSRISVWSNSEAQEMLLYAQRTFINTHFCLYDPAREDMWGEYNRPWDYDHIIPQNWIRERGRARREFRDYCSHWVNRIGNIAAIPFEDNRSKGDRDSYNVYENNADALLFDKAFLDLSKLGAKLTENSEGSYRFAEVIFKRTLDIYRQCYALFDALLKETSLTDLQARRREMMEALALRLDGAETVYVAGNGDARGGGLWRDYPIMRDADWAREWLSVGVRRRDKYFICWAWGCKKNYFEIGVRKLPGRDIEMDTSDLPEMDPSYRIGRGHWWYAYKEMSEDTNEEKIFDEIKSILTRFRTED